jgi:hypothetical protein
LWRKSLAKISVGAPKRVNDDSKVVIADPEVEYVGRTRNAIVSDSIVNAILQSVAPVELTRFLTRSIEAMTIFCIIDVKTCLSNEENQSALLWVPPKFMAGVYTPVRILKLMNSLGNTKERSSPEARVTEGARSITLDSWNTYLI